VRACFLLLALTGAILSGCRRAHAPVPAAPAPVRPADRIGLGKALFGTACIACHQPNGQGIPAVYPPLDGSEWINGPKERLIRIALYGLRGPIRVLGQDYSGVTDMPPFGPQGHYWSDASIACVLTYVRREWGNHASPITEAEVEQLRTRIGPRGEWTAEELRQAGRE